MFNKAYSLAELASLMKNNPDACILAGGTDVMVKQNRRHAHDVPYIDITEIPELHEIRETGDGAFLGATVTFTEVSRNALIRKDWPVLAAAASEVGSVQIRNLGTVGGNVANASPAADSLPALALYGASVIVYDPVSAEKRSVPIEEFILAPGKTVLGKNELVYGFELPKHAFSDAWAYRKIGRRNALAISRMSGCCLVRTENGVIADVRIALGAVYPSPRRMKKAEEAVKGHPITDITRDMLNDIVKESIVEVTGYRKSAEYKLSVAPELIAQLLQNAFREGNNEN